MSPGRSTCSACPRPRWSPGTPWSWTLASVFQAKARGRMDSGLAGKVVLVTGGSRGIGRAIVELFSAEGADVTFLFRENTAAAAEVIAIGCAAGRHIRA